MSKKGRFRLFLSFFMLGVFMSSLEAQTTVQPPESTIGKGRVTLKNGEKFEARQLSFKEGKLTFVGKSLGRKSLSIGVGKEMVFDLNDLDIVSKYGSLALEGAISGGILCLLLSQLIKPIPSTGGAGSIGAGIINESMNALPPILAIGGAVIGALVGSSMKTEKTIFKDGRFLVKLGFQSTIIGLAPQSNIEIVHFRLAF